jgi:mono/diheme cytochrome c family protein
VTDGRLEKFMPGFQGSLDDRQRWDVVAYVYTLSATPQQVETGKTLYTAECASCHGNTGKGDGTKASGANLVDWVKQERLSQLSEVDMDAVISAGKGDMPGYANLSQDQLAALTAYIRSLTFSNANNQQASAAGTPDATTAPGTPSPSVETPTASDTLAPGQTPAAADTLSPGQTPAAAGKVTIQGKISGQNGLKVPGGLAVSLISYEGMNQVGENKGVSGNDGSYSFEVDKKTGLTYMVQVTYNDFTFNSDILHDTDIKNGVGELPVAIYETTPDTAGLSIDRMHVFFDFTKPATVQVAELFIVSNPGQKVIVAGGPDKPVLTFKVPSGAANLQFEGGALGDRFIQTADGFGDLAAIAPGQGQHQVLFSYELPYDNKLSFSIPVPMAVSAAVVMMPQGGVQLQSGQLQASGSKDVQGLTYELFTGSNLAAGSELALSLSGKVQDVSGAAVTTSSSTTGLLIGLGVFGVVLVVAGVWLFRKRAQVRIAAEPDEETEAQPDNEEALVDAILALDDLYQAGKLPEDAYRARRAELKDRLGAILGN